MYGLGVMKSMVVVLRHIFRPPITRQYPEEAVPLAARFRGYDFALLLDRCTVNASCAKACPHGVIDIVSRREPDGRYSLEKFDIDTGLCMECGLCVEICPYDALFMGTGFELAKYDRWQLIVHKEDISARPSLSAYYRPPVMDQARSREQTYYSYDPAPGVPKPQGTAR